MVSGKVTAQDGTPVAFATIKVKGKPTGLSADANGAYSIRVNSTDVLEISGAGFKTIDIAVGNQTVLNTVMEKNGELVEVVVSGGYGIKTSKKIATTNTQTVNAEH
ncbi:MAG: carboxypeptidase-like regulatory domain-containing protein [Ferruginibacter sp.]